MLVTTTKFEVIPNMIFQHLEALIKNHFIIAICCVCWYTMLLSYDISTHTHILKNITKCS